MKGLVRWTIWGAVGTSVVVGAFFLPGISQPVRGWFGFGDKPDDGSHLLRDLIPPRMKTKPIAEISAAAAQAAFLQENGIKSTATDEDRARMHDGVNKCVSGDKVMYTDGHCPVGSKTYAFKNDRLSIVPAFVGKEAKDTTENQGATTAIPVAPGGAISTLQTGQQTLQKALTVQQQVNDQQKAMENAIEHAGK